MIQNQTSNKSFREILNSEKQLLNKTWNKGPYNFLLQRTESYFSNKKTTERRNQLENIINKPLPLIDDLTLENLYLRCLDEYHLKLLKTAKRSGFESTPFETNFMNSFIKIQQNHSKLKNVIIFPNYNNKRLSIGPFIPDFLLIGLSTRGYSIIAIEINGGCHLDKLEKDFAKEDRLHELGIYTLPIQNPQAADLSFIRGIFDDEKIINITDRPEQIQRAFRRIWVKTLVNHWSLERINSELAQENQRDYLLMEEFKTITQLTNCPKAIKKEWSVYQTKKSTI